MKKTRLVENEKLIRLHLVKSHDDKDDNSLFVRFGELVQERERLEETIASLNNVIGIMSTKKHDEGCLCSDCNRFG